MTDCPSSGYRRRDRGARTAFSGGERHRVLLLIQHRAELLLNVRFSPDVTYTAHWNYLFAGHDESGILSGPVETARGTSLLRTETRTEKLPRF
jgi:hypothetical protein